jgi:type VI secretion system protein ImpM
MMNTITGFYGKLPVVGDFVSRRLPHDFINPWDKWLQSAIAASREELGADWLQCYLTSPIWRFLLSPGLCGKRAVAGILMPSVDKAGRYYPFTVAALLEQSAQLPFLFTTSNIWFEQIEDAALTILEGSLDIATFDQLIQRIPPCVLPTDSSIQQQTTVEKKTFYIAMDNPQQLGDAFVGLNAQLLNTFMSGYSLWSSIGAEQVQQPVLLACEGLPAINKFSSFLKGKMDTKDCSVYSELNRKPTLNQGKPMVTKEESALEHPSLTSILASNKILSAPSGWRSWAMTDTGKRRKHNEDSLLNKPEAGLWVVADGMGGHKAGDVASQMIISSLDKLSPIQPLESYIEAVEQCLQDVNSALQQLAAKEYSNYLIGSTVVALICEAQRGAFLWAGDSRLYRFRNRQLQQLTKDHCATDDYEATVYSVKSSNIITRAVGAHEELELELGMTEIINGDIFLLSSDGLDKEMSFNEIEHIMKISNCQDIADTLVREVLARGARDNVTVIVVAAETIL